MNTGENEQWNELAGLEPVLDLLLKEAEAVRDDGKGPSFCANDYWVESSLKFQVGCYAGPGALSREPGLKSSSAYRIAYKKIYEALPPCRNCGC